MTVHALRPPEQSRLDAEVEATARIRDKAWDDYMAAKRAHTDAVFRRAAWIEGRVRHGQGQRP